MATWVFLALVSYVPSFLDQPGKVAADTKQYLYLDPGRLIQSAFSMWDPDVGAGTVTHQNIGYLFPMGPYYWLVQQLHIPMWVGQRFWMGSLFFAAGTGVLFFGRLLGLSRSGRLVAALAYMLTPFTLDYIARISAIVMPWAALGWIMGFTVLAVRRGGWRWPALLAIVVAAVGGVNATSIVLVAVGPLAWVLYAVFITREARLRPAAMAAGRIAVLSVLVSLWWAAGLWAEGAYGINVLKFTETLPTVSLTSSASEAIRGLGYWYFYGQDKLQPWTSAAVPYLQSPGLIALSFLVPTVAAVLGLLSRWRYRAFAVVLVVVGVAVAVGVYPFDDTTPLGRLFESGANSTFGLALRSTNRILPLTVLGFALLLGSGVTALAGFRPWVGLGTSAVVAALVAANLPAMWNGTLVATNLDRPEQIPSYALKAAAYMNGKSHATRVLQFPGQDFAYYRWGVTEDPIWPGLMTRPYLERSAEPQGEPASVNLLQALDESMQDGVFVPSTLVPIAHLLNVGDILYESDVQFERFNNARPQVVWLALTSPETGLGQPKKFGKPVNYTPIEFPLNDETQLAVPTGTATPPPVAVFSVPGTPPIARAQTPSTPLVVAGDGQGLVNAAATGLLDGNPTVFYSASYAKNTKGFDQQLARGAVLVLTDTNQKQEDTWGTTDDNYGYVEQAGAIPLDGSNPAEQTMPIFKDTAPSTQTVAQLRGSDIASIGATSYGNPITNNPENAPPQAVDGNLDTAWEEGAFEPATDQSLEITLKHPVTADHITLVQPQTGPRNRHITRVTLTFDGRSSVTAALGHASTKSAGQAVDFSRRSFRTLKITVDATSAGAQVSYQRFAAVGFAEVQIPGVAPAHQVLRLPTDLLDQAGTASENHELLILMNRLRVNGVPGRTDPELTLQRTFSLPTARTFSIGGTARISTLDADPVVNGLVGRLPAPGQATAAPGGEAEVVFSNSSGRLPGDLNASAYAAMDGNPKTSWMPGAGKQTGNWLSYTLNRPITFDHLNLQVVADGRHSIPTRITISAGDNPSGAGAESETVNLPPVALGKGRPQGATTSVPVSFPALTGSTVKVTIDAVHPLHYLDYISENQNTEPVGIAELGLPGAVQPPTPTDAPTQCLSNLLTIDGQPIDVQISGSTSTALGGGGFTVSGCGNSAHGITLSPGQHLIQSNPHLVSGGLNLDSLFLASAPGGAALPLTAGAQIPVPATPPAATASVPAVHVVSQNRTNVTVSVAGNGHPFWLTLGQSQSDGWKATTSTGVQLGSSTLINGYANGWYVPGSVATGTIQIHLAWTPQKVIEAAIIVSGATLAASVGLVVLPPGTVAGLVGGRRRGRGRHRRGRARRRSTDGPASPAAPPQPALAEKASSVSSAAAEPDRAHRRAAAADQVAAERVPATAGPLRPGLGSLLDFAGRTPRPLWAAVAALVAGGLAAVVVAPLAGLLVAALVVLGFAVRRSRLVFVVGSVGLFVATGVYMVQQQIAHRYPSDINWPSHFTAANTLAWLAVLVLGTEALVALLRGEGPRAGPGVGAPPPPAEGVLEPQRRLLDDEVGEGGGDDGEGHHRTEVGPELHLEEVEVPDLQDLEDPGLMPQVDPVGDDP